jgi:Tannase and feruloyl esterase
MAKRLFSFIAFGVFCACALVSSTHVSFAGSEDRAALCSSLIELNIPNTTITAADLIAAAGSLPEYCRVRGYVDTEIHFEVRLPSNWNGKFAFQGGSAFDGAIPGPNSDPRLLPRGYATAGTDSGHVFSGVYGVFDGSWALNNPERQTNYAYRANHVVTDAGKQILNAYYNAAESHSYFIGCSTGGREGITAANRFPGDYDGIIAGGPTLDYTGGRISANWNSRAYQAAPIPANKLDLIAKEVLRQCDGVDGLVDGLIDDPRSCHFDPSPLLCVPGGSSDCLIAGQINTIQQIYGGPKSSSGVQLFPGFSPGGENGNFGWLEWIVPNTWPYPQSRQWVAQDQFFRFFVYGPTYDWTTFNFDVDPPKLASWSNLINSGADLSAYYARGGKIIMFQGWSDFSANPKSTIQYFENEIGHMGQSIVDSFMRLYMVPGMNHCRGLGPGPNNFDELAALENWIEQGAAPKSIVATHSTGNTVDRTRPLCPYPEVARYTGSGSIDIADNFSCVTQRRITGITLDRWITVPRGSFSVTISGKNLSENTSYDVRFRRPNSSADELALNWQKGTTATHTLTDGISLGSWNITGVRSHDDMNDHTGPFDPVSVILTVVPF